METPRRGEKCKVHPTNWLPSGMAGTRTSTWGVQFQVIKSMGYVYVCMYVCLSACLPVCMYGK